MPEELILVAVVRAWATVSALLLCVHCTGGSRHSPPAVRAAAPAPQQQQEAATAAAAAQTAPPAEEAGERADEPGWLGIELAAMPADSPGVQVADVITGSPAQAAGLRALDVVLQVDGNPVSAPEQVIAAISAHGAGYRAALVLEREGQQRLLAVVLGPRPDGEDILRRRYLGKAAPELHDSMPASGAVQASLYSLRGRVVVLEFWADWCVACRAMLPTLNAWHDHYSAQGLRVIGVTVEDVKQAGLNAGSQGMRYPVLADPDAKVTRAYRAMALPTLFVIDKQGRVRDVQVGFLPARMDQTSQLIEQLLAER
jgi:thiol-disulfide isomerase/thioredoxin